MTLRKKSPIPGAVFWWKNVFVGDPEIDLATITGRRGDPGNVTTELWAEAQRQFRQRIQDQTREPIEVDISSDENDHDGEENGND